MEDKTQILQKLSALRASERFTPSDWEQRGLVPSESEKISEMRYLMNSFLDKLITGIKSDTSEKRIKKIFTDALTTFKRTYFDTEEKEFIADEFAQAAALLNLDIKNILVRWQFGVVPGTFLRLFTRKEKVIESRVFTCEACALSLKVNITHRKPEAHACWIIGRCIQCGTYNLLSSGEKAGAFNFEGFQLVETLDGRATSETEAKTRLDQIRISISKNKIP